MKTGVMNGGVDRTPAKLGDREGLHLRNGGTLRRENRGGGVARRSLRENGYRLVVEFARIVHGLRVVLVQIETGVELCLPGKKVFQAGFVLEGAAQLGSVIGERLLLPLDFMVFVLGAMIQEACPPAGGLIMAAAAHPKVGDLWKAG
jgi:hypothetical protein